MSIENYWIGVCQGPNNNTQAIDADLGIDEGVIEAMEAEEENLVAETEQTHCNGIAESRNSN